MAVIGPQYGCTDPNAINYDPLATIDDGSCTYTPTPTVPPIWHIETMGITVSFSETAKGWTSFKSFIPDNGLSLNNDYYTFKNTTVVDTNGDITSSDFMLWKHHDNQVRNIFYGQQYDSHVDVLFNKESATVKSFASMKYEGSQSKITEDIADPAYFNNEERKGWYVESGLTDLQLAGEMEFKNKEGKWFSYMKGRPVRDSQDLNSSEFSFQGIDILEDLVTIGNVFGCIDPSATNYDPLATDDDGSCVYPPYSCWECKLNDQQILECLEDTDPLNGPCNGYTDKIECENLTNYCTGPPPNLYTLTINDSTPPQQQIKYSVSTFTKTNIPGDSVLLPFGTGGFTDSEYKLEISADTGWTVRASDFAVEFPTGIAGSSILGSQFTSVGVSWFRDDYINVGNNSGIGQGNDLGTGPFISDVTLKDSENPTGDQGWSGPSGSNKVEVHCTMGTDMQDNIPGSPTWPATGPVGPEHVVYMTHNGMSSGNLINTGIPGDLNTFINMIGSAQQPILGCTDPNAVNYSSSATVNDGSCNYGGCMDPTATNYNSLATVDDGSCIFPPVYGCTDSTTQILVGWQGSNPRPEGYFGPASNYNPLATVSCDGTYVACAQAPFHSHMTGLQTGANCCCEYDGCNEIVQSLEGTLSITHNTLASGVPSITGNGEITYNINNNQGGSSWLPSSSAITINIYNGHSSNYVTGMQTNIFWSSSSNASGWGGMAPNYPISSSSQPPVHQANSGANPSNWNHVGPSTTVNGVGLPVGDYHMRVDTSDDCFLWYDFTIEDLSVQQQSVFGCTDPLACNYDASATVDDGSCDSSCYGCTDPAAYGYDATATIDDCTCCYDLDVTFTITADSGGGGLVGNANGIIEIDIPTSIAAGGLPQYDCQGSPYQIQYIIEYHDKRETAGFSFSPPLWNCGMSYVQSNLFVGELTWDAAANSGAGGWTCPTVGAPTPNAIMPVGGCGGYYGQSAMGGYEAGSLSNPMGGNNCAEGDPHYNPGFAYMGSNNGYTMTHPTANYMIWITYRNSSTPPSPSHGSNLCRRFFPIFVPCQKQGVPNTTTTTVTGICDPNATVTALNLGCI